MNTVMEERQASFTGNDGQYRSINEHERESDIRASASGQKPRKEQEVANAMTMLEGMGFTKEQAREALRITEGTSVDRAIDWLCGGRQRPRV